MIYTSRDQAEEQRGPNLQTGCCAASHSTLARASPTNGIIQFCTFYWPRKPRAGLRPTAIALPPPDLPQLLKSLLALPLVSPVQLSSPHTLFLLCSAPTSWAAALLSPSLSVSPAQPLSPAPCGSISRLGMGGSKKTLGQGALAGILPVSGFQLCDGSFVAVSRFPVS